MGIHTCLGERWNGRYFHSHVLSIFINKTSFTQVTRLAEKPTGTKLALLYEKHLYSLVLSFAHTQNLDTTDVHRHHGDYLYEKGDCESAMKEYLQTIGGVRGSHGHDYNFQLYTYVSPAYTDLHTVPRSQFNPS